MPPVGPHHQLERVVRTSHQVTDLIQPEDTFPRKLGKLQGTPPTGGHLPPAGAWATPDMTQSCGST